MMLHKESRVGAVQLVQLQPISKSLVQIAGLFGLALAADYLLGGRLLSFCGVPATSSAIAVAIWLVTARANSSAESSAGKANTRRHGLASNTKGSCTVRAWPVAINEDQAVADIPCMDCDGSQHLLSKPAMLSENQQGPGTCSHNSPRSRFVPLNGAMHERTTVLHHHDGHTAVDCLALDADDTTASEVAQVIQEEHLLQFAAMLGEEPAQAELAQRWAGEESISRASSLFGQAEDWEGYCKGWEAIIEERKPGLRYCAWRRHLRKGLFMYMSRAVYDGVTAQQLAEFVLDWRGKPSWDEACAAQQPLPPPSQCCSSSAGDGSSSSSSADGRRADGCQGACSNDASSSFMYARTRFPPPMAQREYVYARRVWPKADDGGCYCVSRACSHPAPPAAGCRAVRVQDYASGILVRSSSRSGSAPGQDTAELITIYWEDAHVRPGLVNLGLRKAMWPAVQKAEVALRAFCSSSSSSWRQLPASPRGEEQGERLGHHGPQRRRAQGSAGGASEGGSSVDSVGSSRCSSACTTPRQLSRAGSSGSLQAAPEATLLVSLLPDGCCVGSGRAGEADVPGSPSSSSSSSALSACPGASSCRSWRLASGVRSMCISPWKGTMIMVADVTACLRASARVLTGGSSLVPGGSSSAGSGKAGRAMLLLQPAALLRVLLRHMPLLELCRSALNWLRYGSRAPAASAGGSGTARVRHIASHPLFGDDDDDDECDEGQALNPMYWHACKPAVRRWGRKWAGKLVVVAVKAVGLPLVHCMLSHKAGGSSGGSSRFGDSEEHTSAWEWCGDEQAQVPQQQQQQQQPQQQRQQQHASQQNARQQQQQQPERAAGRKGGRRLLMAAAEWYCANAFVMQDFGTSRFIQQAQEAFRNERRRRQLQRQAAQQQRQAATQANPVKLTSWGALTRRAGGVGSAPSAHHRHFDDDVWE